MSTLTETQLCTHCGSDVPLGLVDFDSQTQFCCSGCRAAYELICEIDAEDYYQYVEESAPVATNDQGFQEFDSNSFKNSYTQPIPDSELRVMELAIEGMHCSACIWLIEKLPKMVAGVVKAQVNWNSQSVKITFSPSASLSEVAQKLSKLGYQSTPYHPNEIRNPESLTYRRMVFQLGLAGAAAGNNMLVSLGLYIGSYQGIQPSIRNLLVFYSGLISLVSLFGPGREILKRAIASIHSRTPHMDLPVALGVSVATLSGWLNFFRGSDIVYFDSVSVLIFVLLLGRFLQFRQQRSAIHQVSLLNRITPQFCLVVNQGELKKVLSTDVKVDDVVKVLPGEPIPVDGVVVAGISSLDVSLLTGESAPQQVETLSEVHAGSTNLTESISIRTTRTTTNTRIAKIFQEVEDSIRQKSSIVQFADRIGGKFVMAIMALATIAFFWWSPNWQQALDSAVAVLIVACPCALALSTPLVVSSALSAALKANFLVKDGDVFERISNCNSIWFDKTGTLTFGKLKVVDSYGGTSDPSLIVAMQKHSVHPVANAIIEYLRSRFEVNDLEASKSEIQQHSNGILIDTGEKKVAAGNLNFVLENGFQIANAFVDKSEEFAARGLSPLFVGVDDKVESVLAIGDSIRPGVKPMIADLQRSGYQVGILSGDHQHVVGQVAAELGIESSNVYHGLLPEAKAEKLSQHSGTVMVGDGINDSLALSAAEVGIAVGSNSEVGAKIAPVVVNEFSVVQIDRLIKSGKPVMRLIYQNIAISLAYNLIAVAAAFAGWISPLLAAILMPISSLTVVANSIIHPFMKTQSQ